ncbi:MAG: hypothetical protein HY078_04250 [Elusimicrobia bacterium]|nr:hypothetical protein [Elusimicrobiota bacterium]
MRSVRYPDARSTNFRRYHTAFLETPRQGAAPGVPSYAAELVRLGASEALAAALRAFLAQRHPGDQARLYHSLVHTEEVASLAAAVVRRRDDMSAGEKALVIVSAALHDLDPERVPDTPARVAATLSYLDDNTEARRLLGAFCRQFEFTTDQVKALILATDYSGEAREQEIIEFRAELAAATAFCDDARGLGWGRLIAFLDRVASYIGSEEEALRRLSGLARELRTRKRAGGHPHGPSDAQVLAETPVFLEALRRNPLYRVLSEEERERFEAVRSVVAAAAAPAGRFLA